MGFILLLLLTGCSRIDESAIENNSVIIAPGNLSVDTLKPMHDKKAIMVGEFPGTLEHQELLAELVKTLHEERRIDSVILEDRHAYSWIFEDYVLGRIDDGLFTQNIFQKYEVFLEAIRNYNNELSQEEKISVKSGDINFQHDQFLSSLQFMRRYLADREIINRFLNRLRTTADKKTELLEFKEFISEERPFTDEEDIDWNERIMNLIEIEIDSMEPRERWQEDYVQAHQLREEVLKKIASQELNQDKRVLFNYGFNHAQKAHHFGTEKEWLGEFLTSHHPISKDETYNLTLVPVSGELVAQSGNLREVDLFSDQLDQELLSTTAELMGKENYIYLHLNPDKFSSDELKINLHFQQIEAVPYDLYDGFILIPRVTPNK